MDGEFLTVTLFIHVRVSCHYRMTSRLAAVNRKLCSSKLEPQEIDEKGE
jgi:hypothetical protein